MSLAHSCVQWVLVGSARLKLESRNTFKLYVSIREESNDFDSFMKGGFIQFTYSMS